MSADALFANASFANLQESRMDLIIRVVVISGAVVVLGRPQGFSSGSKGGFAGTKVSVACAEVAASGKRTLERHDGFERAIALNFTGIPCRSDLYRSSCAISRGGHPPSRVWLESLTPDSVGSLRVMDVPRPAADDMAILPPDWAANPPTAGSPMPDSGEFSFVVKKGTAAECGALRQGSGVWAS